MTAEQLALKEANFNVRFGTDGWKVSAYNSPSEKAINKPLLTVTDPTTNHMGEARIWPGPDTALVEAVFISTNYNRHTAVFTSTDGAIEWLDRQFPDSGRVEP